MRNSVTVLAGPTASGKSALATALAEAAPITIVNADSMQVYAALRVLTARPSAADEAAIPHRLYGHIAAAQRYSVAAWLADAAAAIRAAWAAGRHPVVVGGTGLYLTSLIRGLSPVPALDEGERRAVEALRDAMGAARFHAALAARDPVMAARLSPADRTRTIRAWAVLETTGRSLADWQQQPRQPPLPEAYFTIARLLPEVRDLTPRIDSRFDAMIEQGALDEVRALIELRLAPDLPAMKAVGVPELAGYLAGERSLADAKAAAKLATRQLAKRQRTWLKTQMPRHADAENVHGSHDLFTGDSKELRRIAHKSLVRPD